MPQPSKKRIAGQVNEAQTRSHKGGGHVGAFRGVLNGGAALYNKKHALSAVETIEPTPTPTTPLPIPHRKKGTPPLSSVEKRWFAVLRLLCLRSNHGGKAPKKQSESIARSIGVTSKRLDEIARMACSGKSLVRKSGSGRKSVVQTKPVVKWFKEKHAAWKGHWTMRRMSAAMKEQCGGVGSVGSVARIASAVGLKRVAARLLPMLNESHMAKRVEFSNFLIGPDSPVCQSTTMFGFLDEKWFLLSLLQKRVWVDVEGGEERPTFFIKSKQHQSKVMFLGAVGMPREEHGFNGDIGLWPIGTVDLAERASANRPAGTPVFRPMEIDRALTLFLLKYRVVPATLDKCKWATSIVWVLDNAGGHGGGRGDMKKTVLDPLNDWCADLPGDIRAHCANPATPPRITFIAQSPHSPDLNALDNGAWWSLQVAVDALNTKRGGVMAPTEIEVHDAVMEAWEGWVSAERIKKTFESVVLNAHRVVETGGRNDYTQPHNRDVN